MSRLPPPPASTSRSTRPGQVSCCRPPSPVPPDGSTPSFHLTLNPYVLPSLDITFLLAGSSCLVGGLGSMRGVAIATVLLGAGPELIGFATTQQVLISGILVLVVVLLAPRGVGGVIDQLERLKPSRKPGAGVGRTENYHCCAFRRIGQLNSAGLTALQDVDLDIAQQGICGVIGPNGAGKSTLFNVVAGALAPTAGEVMLGGMSIGGMPSHHVAAAGISRAFQLVNLFGSMTVAENVLAGAERHDRLKLWQAVSHLAGYAAERRAAVARARRAI